MVVHFAPSTGDPPLLATVNFDRTLCPGVPLAQRASAPSAAPRGAVALLAFLGSVQITLHGLCVNAVAIDGLRIGAAFRACDYPVPVFDAGSCLSSVSVIHQCLSCNKPVGAHQTVKFVPTEIDGAAAQDRAAAF